MMGDEFDDDDDDFLRSIDLDFKDDTSIVKGKIQS